MTVIYCGIFASVPHLIIAVVTGYEPVLAVDSEITNNESLGGSDLASVSRAVCKPENAARSGPHNVQGVAADTKSESDVVNQAIHIFLAAKEDRILVVNISVGAVRYGHAADCSMTNRFVTM